MTEEQIFEICQKENVKFINLQFSDVLGISKAVTIPYTKLKSAIHNNVWFDGSSIEGFTRIFESDQFLKPDLDTFAVIPWTIGTESVTARIICDVFLPDGQPFKGDPRYILKNQVKRAEEMGYTFYTGPELEFFLFKKENGHIEPLPHDRGGYFDQSTDQAAEVRKEMSLALQMMGIDVETLHHEVAIGQHEIDFKYNKALMCADNAITFKLVLKAIAAKYDLHATFMPKPIAGINGSGMHVHQSLFKGDENAFYDDAENYKLSKVAKQYIAGQLAHMKEICAVTNPVVNSYKRLVVGYEAPVYLAWGQVNRSALIRIPRFTEGNKKGARIELRSPDPSCNPYLAFAVMLAAGLDGIEKGMTPPEPLDENIYDFDDAKIKQLNIENLPIDLGRALNEFKKSQLVRETLGDHTYKVFYEAKKKEWDSYRTSVSKWELDRYLEIY